MKFLTPILRFRFETEIHSVKANATTKHFTIEVEMAPEKADLVVLVVSEHDNQPVSGAAVRLDCEDPSTTDANPDTFANAAGGKSGLLEDYYAELPSNENEKPIEGIPERVSKSQIPIPNNLLSDPDPGHVPGILLNRQKRPIPDPVALPDRLGDDIVDYPPPGSGIPSPGPTETEDGDELGSLGRYELLDAVPWAGQGSCRLIVEKEGQVKYLLTPVNQETRVTLI